MCLFLLKIYLCWKTAARGTACYVLYGVTSKLISSAEIEPKDVSLTDAVVTDAAVRRSWRTEDFAGVAVLQLDDLVVDLHVPDPRGGALARGHVPIGCLCGKHAR